MSLVETIYRITNRFPATEEKNLVSQMRRSAVSIPSNIAEGQYRFSTKQNIQFLKVAYASCAELETQTQIAHMLGYIAVAEKDLLQDDLEEILRMLNALLHRKK